MAKTNYYTTWRSRETCLAMELTEETIPPLEYPLCGDDLRADEVDNTFFGTFGAGDFEIHQNGRVFGRTKADHEERFQRAVARGKGESE